MDLIAGALSSRFLLIFLVIFPPVLIWVWLIHHPCRDIVANRATGSFCIMANTLTQPEIYYLPLILSTQARLGQAFDSLTVHLDSMIVFKVSLHHWQSLTPNNREGNCFPWDLEQAHLLWIPLSNWDSKQTWNKFQAQMECTCTHTRKLIPGLPSSLFLFLSLLFPLLSLCPVIEMITFSLLLFLLPFYNLPSHLCH